MLGKSLLRFRHCEEILTRARESKNVAPDLQILRELKEGFAD